MQSDISPTPQDANTTPDTVAMTDTSPTKDDTKNVTEDVARGPVVEESTAARIERLGRMRPEKFNSIWEEAGFCFSVVMSQALTVMIILIDLHADTDCELGVLCFRIQCYSASRCGKPRYS